MGASTTLAFVSRAPAATEELGRVLGAALVSEARTTGIVVALTGELGSGKTTLVRGLARGLGVAEAVTSPSFTLMHEYPGPVPLYHFDAWMAGRESAFLEGGGADYLGAEGVAVVEWAERIQDLLPAPRLDVRLAHRAPDERRLELRVVRAGGGAGAGELEQQAALEALLRALGGALGAVSGLDPEPPVSPGPSTGS